MISDILTADHKRIDIQLERVISALHAGKDPIDGLSGLREALRRHIYFEETVLFRMVENEENLSRVNGLEAEHGGILQLIDRIEDYLVKKDMTRAVDRAEGLARVLASHDEIEVSTVYAELDQTTHMERQKIADDFSNVKVPDDWISRVQARYSRKRNSS